MTIPKADVQRMARLAQEGKTIADIWREDFQEKYPYWDVYWAIRGEGQASALGVKRSISNRLKKLETCGRADRHAIIREIGDLVWHLYGNYRASQDKIERVRQGLG